MDVGGGLLLGAAILAPIVGAQSSQDAWPEVALLLGVGTAMALGRLAGSFDRRAIPVALVLVAIGLALTSTVVGGGPLRGPFGYRNATAAFFVQATVAAAMLVVAARPRWLRIVGLVAVLAFGIVASSDAVAAAVGLAVLVVVTLVAMRGRVRPAIAVAGTLVALALVTTVVLGVAQPRGGFVTRALSERRVALWHDSLRLIAQHPGGMGPGGFAQAIGPALRDRDARWAEDEFLQQGVELGWAGLALAILLFAWGFARLWMHPAPDLVVALGAASLAGLGIQAAVDHVLHTPAIPLAAAALVGSAQAIPRRRTTRDDDDDREEGVEGDADPARVAGSPTSG